MIQQLAQQNPPEYMVSGDQEEELRAHYQMLTLSSSLGMAVYSSYSDRDLLDVLRDTASRIGRAPTQDEIFFLYRTYLKARFGTWPAALRAAGMRRLPTPDLIMPDWVQVMVALLGVTSSTLNSKPQSSRSRYPVSALI